MWLSGPSASSLTTVGAAAPQLLTTARPIEQVHTPAPPAAASAEVRRHQRDVTFNYGDESTTLDTIDALGDTPGGGGAGETVVPEPTTLMLLGSGLSAMAIRRRRTIRERS